MPYRSAPIYLNICRGICSKNLVPIGGACLWDFLLYIEKSAIWEKNSDGRGRFKIR